MKKQKKNQSKHMNIEMKSVVVETIAFYSWFSVFVWVSALFIFVIVFK